MAHIITGVIGAGVLSLAWSMAQLGWIAGPLAMVLFASVTLISTYLLCNCYKTPDPEVGPVRNRSYIDAVNMNLGEIFKQFIIFFLLTPSLKLHQNIFLIIISSVDFRVSIGGTLKKKTYARVLKVVEKR